MADVRGPLSSASATAGGPLGISGAASNSAPPPLPVPALLAGALLLPAASLWVVRSEIVFRSADLAANSLPVAAFFYLLLALALRRPLARAGLPISRASLLLVYAMLATTVGLSSLGFAQSLIIQLPAPFYRASPENRWEEFLELIPGWVAPSQPRILRGFYLGASLWDGPVLRAWAWPLAAWCLMLLALTGAMLSLAWLLQRRFIHDERLVFPLAIVPVELAGLGPLRITAARLFWLGLTIAAGLQVLNAAHHQWPQIPGLRVLPHDLRPLLTNPPWNAIGSFWLAFYPCAIGLGYLLPSDTALSCWLWHLAVKAEYVLSGSLGRSGLGWPLQGEQAQGAMLALALLALWPRGRLRLSALEPAHWALLGCLAALVGFGTALGLRPAQALAFFALYLLGLLAVTRLRAQVGPMWNPGTDTQWLLMAPLGSRALTRRDLTALALLRWFSYGDCRGAPLPTQLEALKIAQLVGIPPATMVLALAAALLLAAPSSLLATLDTYYRWGADTAHVDPWRTGRGDLPYHTLVGWLANPQGPQASALAAIGLGGLALWLQALAVTRLPWWPLQPAGFAMAITGSLEWLWFPMFIAWVAKVAVLRWGGASAYRRSIPLFIGLVAGDYLVCACLAVLSWILHRDLYKPFPI